MAGSGLVCFVTLPSKDAAGAMAQKLVEERLAACVNVVGEVRSIYRWEGKICDEGEALCVIKTTAQAFEKLRARIVELHSYSVPEIIAVPIVAGHQPYFDWLAGQVD